MKPLTFLKTFIAKLNHDECPLMASAMAFAFMGAVVPSLIFIISVLGLMGHQKDVVTMTLHAVEGFAPQDTMHLLKETIQGVIQSSNRGLGIFGLLAALWSSSRGAAIIVRGLDRAYNIPLQNRPIWYEPVSSILIVLSLGLVLLFVANLILFGQPWIRLLGETFHFPVQIEHFLQMARWTLSVFSVIGCSTLIYGLLLKFKLKKYYWRAAVIGSLVFTMLWFGLSLLFSFYIQAFGNYNPVYGSLGAIVFLMTWFYLSAMSILIAGEIISIIALPKEAVDIVETAKQNS